VRSGSDPTVTDSVDASGSPLTASVAVGSGGADAGEVGVDVAIIVVDGMATPVIITLNMIVRASTERGDSRYNIIYFIHQLNKCLLFTIILHENKKSPVSLVRKT
jgi:hypothetical protein